MKYSVVVGNDIDDFEKSVKNKLENGWELAGGISTLYFQGRIWYLQAITKDS